MTGETKKELAFKIIQLTMENNTLRNRIKELENRIREKGFFPWLKRFCKAFVKAWRAV